MKRGKVGLSLFVASALALVSIPARASQTTIEGTIVDERGVAVSGVEVHLKDRYRSQGMCTATTGGCFCSPSSIGAKTDELGWFQLELEKHDVRPLELLVVGRDELVPRRRIHVLPKASARTPLSIVMVPAVQISGTVTCADAPKPKFAEDVLAEIETVPTAEVDREIGYSRADHTFFIGGLPSGEVTLQIDAWGCPRTYVTVRVPSEDMEIQIPRGTTVTGIVLDESGHPAAKARVTLAPTDASRGNPEGMTTGIDGRFEFSGVGDGEYRVAASTLTQNASQVVTWHGRQARQVVMRLAPMKP